MRYTAAVFATVFAAALAGVLPASSTVLAAEFHVAIGGKDDNPGTLSAPFRTIQHGADIAQPGDVITVHAGIYRERISPPRGGESDAKRIVYRAADGEKVVIKGSEVVKNWQRVENDTWKVVLPKSFFGTFNPFNDMIRGDWFRNHGKKITTGAVYLNGHWLTQTFKFADVLKPVVAGPFWFAQVDDARTTIWAQFKGVNPNKQAVEINVRRTVFYPEKPGMNYITVRGFVMQNAATPWSPPTAEQVGLIGTHWSKGWLIEDNEVSYSTCAGITLGKHGDEFDNTSANTAGGYVKTIHRGLARGWSKDCIGSHTVRNNHIHDCEQGGIVGSLGAAFCTIEGNTIHDIYSRKLFSGAEMAGIKFHGAIDTVIRENHIYRCGQLGGIWLDWMAQGTRVTRNLLHDNAMDVFMEVNHGPYLIDNNIFLSKASLRDVSEGGAFVNNLIGGRITMHPELGRKTPYHPAHVTKLAGLAKTKGGDNRFYNNMFINPNALAPYDKAAQPVTKVGNVTVKAAMIVEKADGFYLNITIDSGQWAKQRRPVVTTELLGRTKVSDLPYENPDGSTVAIDSDYFGKKRSKENPMAGPIEGVGEGNLTLRVWKLNRGG